MARYEFDEEGSLLCVLVENDASTLLSRMGHDHVIRATGWHGAVDYVASDVAASRVSFEVPVKGLRADEAASRQRVGLTGEVSASDRQKTEENMLKKSQLFGERHPTISFVSTSCRPGSGSSLLVCGTLSVRGVSKALEVAMDVVLEGTELLARGRFSVTHADFGFSAFSAPLGTLKNKDTIEFVIEARGRAKA
ncbi:MAG: YceI family protein [Bradymonadaceae bacterium]|nr:YceI family protein [Lujinxingiaceae bacterium]